MNTVDDRAQETQRTVAIRRNLCMDARKVKFMAVCTSVRCCCRLGGDFFLMIVSWNESWIEWKDSFDENCGISLW